MALIEAGGSLKNRGARGSMKKTRKETKKETAFFQKGSEGDGWKKNMASSVILEVALTSVLVPPQT
jgi:hypothetical protein